MRKTSGSAADTRADWPWGSERGPRVGKESRGCGCSFERGERADGKVFPFDGREEFKCQKVEPDTGGFPSSPENQSP
jgi:hypothetical protein